MNVFQNMQQWFRGGSHCFIAGRVKGLFAEGLEYLGRVLKDS